MNVLLHVHLNSEHIAQFVKASMWMGILWKDDAHSQIGVLSVEILMMEVLIDVNLKMQRYETIESEPIGIKENEGMFP